MTLSLSACLMPVQAATQITVKAGDHFFDAPAQVQAGFVSIRFENHGEAPHHMQIAALQAGVSHEALMAAFPKAGEAWTPERMANVMALFKSMAGGPGLVAPGGSERVTVKLAPGRYLLFCVIPGEACLPSEGEGMMATLDVVGELPNAQPEPASDATVRMADFSFTMPPVVKAGEQTWKIVNEGRQLHEISLHKLAEGKTPEDVVAFYSAPQSIPPFVYVGGFQGIDPGGAGWLHLNLEPGRYVALCPIPDLAGGTPHHMLGMVHSFTVE
jgi:uncharacterized cupredoxin-like copper-binding protein